MNLTLPILLAVAGIALLVTGVLGKLKVKEWFDLATESGVARGALIIVGIGLIGLSYVVYRPETQSDQITKAAEPAVVSAASQESDPAQDETAPQVTITSPNSNDEITEPLADGSVYIPVSGEVDNADFSGDKRVFVFTSSAGSTEWRYEEPARIDSAGTWKTSAPYGSADDPAQAGAPVYVQAVLATQKAVDKAKKNKNEKLIEDLDDIEGATLSKKVVVHLAAQE